MNPYLDLYLTFARIGVCTFGGGYAMLPILQREVVEHLRVKPSTVNGILDRMEEKGLIRRTTDENDQRQKRVMTTEKGRELREQVQTAFQDAEAAMFRGLRPDEVDLLRSLLCRIIENLEEDRTPC